METFLEFFEPTSGLSIWIGKFILISIGGYFVVWLLASILCRIGWRVGEDNQLSVYFAWMMSFVLHLILIGVGIIFTAIHFKQQGFSLWQSAPYILLILISGNYAYTLNNKINERIRKLERRIRE